MKIVTIIGARPQFIKAAVVSRAIAQQAGLEEILVHTGQHFDANMSDVFFDELSIPRPAYNLDVHGGSHGQNTGRMLEKIEAVLQEVKPDGVLVYGDTDSTLAGALAAAKLKIPVIHVEAGLRSYNRAMPEEINRVMTDHLSSLLLTPTKTADANLKKEGIDDRLVRGVGDVMYDAALYYAQKAVKPTWFDAKGLSGGDYVLATIHRAENTDKPENLSAIVTGLSNSGQKIVLPLHPRTKEKLKTINAPMRDNIIIVDPVGYLEMVWLEKNARLIATDSGGVQKEAYFHGRPCVTLRNETEWVELCESGWNVLVGADADKIASQISALFTQWQDKDAPSFYGDGRSGERIASLLVETLG